MSCEYVYFPVGLSACSFPHHSKLSSQLSLLLTYICVCPPGQTTFGHGPMDINIQGPGVAAQHCYIENKSGVITLHPCGNPCAIDGLQVTKPVRLSQGRALFSNIHPSIINSIILYYILKCFSSMQHEQVIFNTEHILLQKADDKTWKDLICENE